MRIDDRLDRAILIPNYWYQLKMERGARLTDLTCNDNKI